MGPNLAIRLPDSSRSPVRAVDGSTRKHSHSQGWTRPGRARPDLAPLDLNAQSLPHRKTRHRPPISRQSGLRMATERDGEHETPEALAHSICTFSGRCRVPCPGVPADRRRPARPARSGWFGVPVRGAALAGRPVTRYHRPGDHPNPCTNTASCPFRPHTIRPRVVAVPRKSWCRRGQFSGMPDITTK